MMPVRTRLFAGAALAALTLPTLGLADDSKLAEQGELAFNNACRTCHTMKDGDNRLGPHLSGIVGRKAGAVDGYAASSSLQNAGFTWDDATLDKFIENPDSVVPGNNMKPFTGIADAQERKKIVSFLKAQGG